MRKLDKHVYIVRDLDSKILASSKKSKRSYSEELNFIVSKYYQEQDEIVKIMCSLDSDMKFITRKMNILFELVKQIYSDMNFTNIRDPKNSYALNEFMKKIRSDKYDS